MFTGSKRVSNLLSVASHDGDHVTLSGLDLSADVSLFRVGDPYVLLGIVWFGLVLNEQITVISNEWMGDGCCGRFWRVGTHRQLSDRGEATGDNQPSANGF